MLLENTKKKASARLQFSSHLLNDVKPRFDHMEQESVATAKRCADIMQGLQVLI
jgi:hypothetical protein